MQSRAGLWADGSPAAKVDLREWLQLAERSGETKSCLWGICKAVGVGVIITSTWRSKLKPHPDEVSSMRSDVEKVAEQRFIGKNSQACYQRSRIYSGENKLNT